MSQKPVRQGEILLVPVKNAPKSYEATPASRQVVLGIGETGNAHLLVTEDTAVRWLYDVVEDINDINKNGGRVAQRQLFVEVSAPARIEHSDPSVSNRHGSVLVEPGIYSVHIDRDQFPWETAARMVAD